MGIYAANEYQNGTTTEQGALSLSIKNSIIYGDKENSIVFKPTSGQTFNATFQNCLLKYGTGSSYAIDAGSIKNQDPKFQNYFTHKMNLRVKDDSPAKGKGNVTVAASVPTDIVGVSRTASPTIGAYQ